MLYLAIDQHSKQITVCVRNADGDAVLRRQVNTRTALFAGIGHKHLVLALRATNSRKALLQISTLEKGCHGAFHDRPPVPTHSHFRRDACLVRRPRAADVRVAGEEL